MENQYNFETIRATIHYDKGKTLVISSDDTANNKLFISSARASANENGSSNPFGIIGSRSYTLDIVDIDDVLSPSNASSPYYDKIKNGCMVEIDIENEETNGEYRPDGTYYINSISGSFSEGAVNECSISVSDDMNSIGGQENPEIYCYKDILVSDFLHIIFTSQGISDYEWELDGSYADTKLVYGITLGTKIRDTLNGLAQYLQARIIRGRDNKIKIIPATKTSGKVYNLPYGLVNDLENAYVTSADYGIVNLTYNPNVNTVRDVILNDNSFTLNCSTNGTVNNFNNISFNRKVVSVETVKARLDHNRYNAILQVVSYNAHQDGMSGDDTTPGLSILAVGESGEIGDFVIYAEGNVIDTATNTIEKIIPGAESPNAINIELQYIIQDKEAEVFASKLADLVKAMNRKITIKTFATPDIDLGDTVTLNDEDYTDTYKGTYRVIGYNTVHGIDFSNTLTLIRI